MTKKILLLTLLLMVAFTSSAYAVNVTINDREVIFDDESGAPFIDESNRTLVPLRVTMEAFGCNVKWDDNSRTAIINKGGYIVKVPIGESYINVNGNIVLNDTEAQIKEDRTYLPIRIVLEAFGAKVNWDSTSNTVMVKQDHNLHMVAVDSVNLEKISNYLWYGINSKLYNLRTDRINETYNIANDNTEVYFQFNPSLYIQGERDLRVEGEIITLLSLINKGYTVSDENPYIDGTLEITDLRPYKTMNMKIEENVDYSSATQKVTTYTYTFKNKSLTTPTSDESLVEQDGVQFIKYIDIWLVNINDFLGYFDLDNTVYIEYNDTISDYCLCID